MPLTTTVSMLRKAQEQGFAVGAFNVENMEMAQAIISAAEELRAPVILQTTPSTVRYAGTGMYAAMVAALAQEATVPVAMHLDHGDSFALCAQALRSGYTSVMIDGSKLPLEENIALTYKVSEMCAAVGVPVEGEIGRVGGKEDDLESDGGYTIPEEAVRFEKESGLFSMAVGVGTAHGFYKEKPQLNKELITTLRGMLQAPMVLHGASGLSDEDVKDCIRRGICKVNFATELRAAYTEGVKAVLAENPKTFDPKAYGKEARQRVKSLVMERMLVCGCDGKA
ncbi:MAG: class II fructose-bisphosphate aldolase [Acutalibacter sp.]|jgi:tagatose 1,6-diphosphate aldolase GatY/KbaY